MPREKARIFLLAKIFEKAKLVLPSKDYKSFVPSHTVNPARKNKKYGGIIMSLKVKLISTISAFILVLSMLFVGVFAATNNFTINLKGNVEFNIDDSTLYIKDIRLSDGLTAGETIDSFLPGFAKESFDLDFGSITSDSGTVVIEIDVINTTTTAYSASSESSISNATLSVSGTIAGDSVPIAQVATYTGISGTIQITIQTTSLATINLNNIMINITESAGYNFTFINSTSTETARTIYIRVDEGEVQTIESGQEVKLYGKSIYISDTRSDFEIGSYSMMGEIELYAPSPGGVSYALTINEGSPIWNDGTEWAIPDPVPNGNIYLFDSSARSFVGIGTMTENTVIEFSGGMVG